VSRALVLSGGGVLGFAWLLGLVDGFRDQGVEPGDVDLVIGTSAGAIAGASLARSAADTIGQLQSVGLLSAFNSSLGTTGPNALLDAMQGASDLGKLAREGSTLPEETYVKLMGEFVGPEWPRNFACTGVDTYTGQLQAWRSDSGVPLAAAVASSCAVPGVIPAITIGSSRYMDGGVHDPLNIGVAKGFDHVVALSCFPVTTVDGLHPRVQSHGKAIERSVADLRAAGSRVALIEPDAEFLALSQGGLGLLDSTNIPQSFEAGRRLGSRSDAFNAKLEP
jgi:NTE family protein